MDAQSPSSGIDAYEDNGEHAVENEDEKAKLLARKNSLIEKLEQVRICSLPPLAVLTSCWPILLSGRAHRFPLNASGARNARAAGPPTRKVALNQSEIMFF